MVTMKTTEHKVTNVSKVPYSPGESSTGHIETPQHFKTAAFGSWGGCVGVMPVAFGAWGAVPVFLPNALPQRGADRRQGQRSQRCRTGLLAHLWVFGTITARNAVKERVLALADQPVEQLYELFVQILGRGGGVTRWQEGIKGEVAAEPGPISGYG